MGQASTETVWNSLEIAKLLISALTPLLVIVVGFWVNRRLKRIEQLQWANQKVIEKRIEVFDKLAPLMNDMLAYFTYIGIWRELTPPDIIAHKRELDRTFYVYAPLFSQRLTEAYNAFITLCFLPYQGWGHSAKLRTHTQRRIEAAGNAWNSAWDMDFANDTDVPDPNSVRDSYKNLMSVFASELGLGLKPADLHAGPVPGNIR